MRIRLATALAIGVMLAASACGSEEPENESTDVSDAVGTAENTTEEAAEGDAAESDDGGSGGEGVGTCDEGVVADAVAEIVTAASVELTIDDSDAEYLSCTWDTGQDTGPAIYLTASPSVDVGITEELLDSMGQTPVDDERFASVGATLVEVLGCEAGHAGDLVGCALTVYGSYEVTLQVLFAEAVTVDQMVEATWAITEQVY